MGQTGALLSHNVFAYCGNNPVNMIDPSGQSFWSALKKTLTVVAVVAVVVLAVAATVATGGGAALAFAGIAGSALAATTATAATVATAAAVTTAVAVTATGAAAVAEAATSNYNFSKPSKSSGKERSTHKPSWVNKGMVNGSKSAQQNARIMLNDKYGVGGWKTGGGTEYNEIIKWITRCLRG